MPFFQCSHGVDVGDSCDRCRDEKSFLTRIRQLQTALRDLVNENSCRIIRCSEKRPCAYCRASLLVNERSLDKTQ